MRTGNRRFAALVAAVAVIAFLAGTLVVRGCGGDEPPSAAAARLVPGDALVYVSLSTDEDREAVERAGELARRFPGFDALTAALISRLDAEPGGAGVDFDRDVRPWLGGEAALALLNTRSATAGSLIVLEVRDRAAARRFVERAAGAPRVTRRAGAEIRTYGTVATAMIGGHLVIGQPAGVRAAADLGAGRGASLAGDPTFRRATQGMPDGRFAEAYASSAGVRRLLIPQGGVLGALGTLLDQPRLAGTAIGTVAEDDGLRARVHAALRPGGKRSFAGFEPELHDRVPRKALAYLGVAGLDQAVGSLLRTGVASALGVDAGELLARARRELQRSASGALERDVVALFRDETAVFVAPRLPTPVLTIAARTDDERATRATLARLQGPLARLFAPPRAGPGQAPTFQERRVAGVTVQQLALAPGVEIDYAVFDGLLVVATGLEGIRLMRESGGRLADAGGFERAVEGRPTRLTSLLFLDLSQLLRLGEQSGLRESPTYLAVRGDLEKVRSVGAYSSGGEADTTAELFFEIP